MNEKAIETLRAKVEGYKHRIERNDEDVRDASSELAELIDRGRELRSYVASVQATITELDGKQTRDSK